MFNAVSRDDKQLAGYAIKGKESNCPNDTKTLPCGYVANSVFNDKITEIRTMRWWVSNGSYFPLSKDELAFPNEDKVYSVKEEWTEGSGDEPKAWKGTNMHKQYFSQDREDFKVWMRSAPLPNFRKLWYKSNLTLKNGDEIKIEVNWPPFNTTNLKKKVIITQANFMGGKSLKKGLISLGISIFFFVSSMLLFHMSRQDNK